MNILIFEDEKLASDRLTSMLLSIDPEIVIVDTIKSVEEGIAWFEENEEPDIIMSDIRLLDGLSFDIFKAANPTSPIIFTTAYDQYAIKAFEVNSIDYLLKPIQKEKLEGALMKYQSINPFEASAPNYSGLIDLIKAQQREFKSRFMIRVGQKILAVPVEKIAYFFSQSKLSYVMAQDGKKYPLDQTLDVIVSQLDPKLFYRVNRQFIVKFDSIAQIHPYFKGRIKIELTPPTNQDIVISSEKTPEFKAWLDQ